jgi:hypothetical protein
MSTPIRSKNGTSDINAIGFTDRDSVLTIQGKVPKFATDQSKKPEQRVEYFSTISSGPASGQAIAFLNAFAPYLQPNQDERIYQEWKIFCELQKVGGVKEDSPHVNRVIAQKFLEKLKRSLTAQQFTQEFKEIDSNSDGNMSFVEYLLWDNKHQPHVFNPASMMYRPHVCHETSGPNFLQNKINAVLKIEREIQAWDDQKAANLAASQDPNATKIQRAKADQEYKRNCGDEDKVKGRFTGDLASAQLKLLTAYHKCQPLGANFWAKRVQQDKDSDKSQKSQGRK